MMKIFECGCSWIYSVAGLTALLLRGANPAKRGEHIGFKTNQIMWHMHNHPTNYTTNEAERESMGQNKDGKMNKDQVNDWWIELHKYRKNGNKTPYPSYVYFDYSNNLYQLTPYNTGPVFLKTVTNHTQFPYQGTKRK